MNAPTQDTDVIDHLRSVLSYLEGKQGKSQEAQYVATRCSSVDLINKMGRIESLLDGGSQIVAMDIKIAKNLAVSWDPDIKIQMQSANKTVEETLGLAKNVPFIFGDITVYTYRCIFSQILPIRFC